MRPPHPERGFAAGLSGSQETFAISVSADEPPEIDRRHPSGGDLVVQDVSTDAERRRRVLHRGPILARDRRAQNPN